MDINPNADISSLVPKKQRDQPPTIYMVEGIEEETRKGQYRLIILDDEGQQRSLRFLWEKQLAPLAREFGTNTDEWKGKKVSVSVEVSKSDKVDAEGEKFYNWVLAPFETKIKTQ